jgi:hypothetical protein
MKLKLIFTASIAVLLLSSGCANVKPWERGTLTDYTMQSDRSPIQSAQVQHIYMSREEATGGSGVGGGGCGCN